MKNKFLTAGVFALFAVCAHAQPAPSSAISAPPPAGEEEPKFLPLDKVTINRNVRMRPSTLPRPMAPTEMAPGAPLPGALQAETIREIFPEHEALAR